MEITPAFVAEFTSGKRPFDIAKASKQQLRDIWNISRGKTAGMSSSSPHSTKEALIDAIGKLVENVKPTINKQTVEDYVAGRVRLNVKSLGRQELRDIWNISRGKAAGMSSSYPHTTKEALMDAVAALPGRGKIVDVEKPSRAEDVVIQSVKGVPYVDPAHTTALTDLEHTRLMERLAEVAEREEMERQKAAAVEKEKAEREAERLAEMERKAKAEEAARAEAAKKAADAAKKSVASMYAPFGMYSMMPRTPAHLQQYTPTKKESDAAERKRREAERDEARAAAVKKAVAAVKAEEAAAPKAKAKAKKGKKAAAKEESGGVHIIGNNMYEIVGNLAYEYFADFGGRANAPSGTVAEVIAKEKAEAEFDGHPFTTSLDED